MKKIEAYVQPEKMEDIIDALKKEDVNGVSISQIRGVGNQMGWKEHVRGEEIEFNFLPKIKIEIVTLDDKVDSITDCISDIARTGDVGDGKIFIYDVRDAIRIRTQERGDSAIQ